MSSNGESTIYTFPFRILAAEACCEQSSNHRGYRFKLYEPFLVRKEGSPLTDAPPFSEWPKFKWSSKVAVSDRLEPPSNIKVSSAPYLFDAIRVDCWGRESEKKTDNFVRRFLDWLRMLSHQPWIGAIDQFFETNAKNRFPIDRDGRALKTPYALARVHVPEHIINISNEIWKHSFWKSVHEIDVPPYWNVYFNGLNANATQDYATATLSFCMAIEAARDYNFSRLFEARFVENLGYRLGTPFDHTDLLKHLSVNLEAECGRNLEKDFPDTWREIKRLYLARHNVAHGRMPCYPLNGQMKQVDSEDLKRWPAAVRSVLNWIEQLAEETSE